MRVILITDSASMLSYNQLYKYRYLLKNPHISLVRDDKIVQCLTFKEFMFYLASEMENKLFVRLEIG